jgi:hypothetical protein
VSDLENLAEIPEDAVVRTEPTDEEGEVTRAILRLAGAPAARDRLGRAARRFVLSAHTPERMREAYEAALRRAARLPPVPKHPGWPEHWRVETGP